MIRLRSQRDRSCSASGISSPLGSALARTASLGQQHQRQQAGDLRVVGQRPPDDPGQADRLAGEVAARQLRAAAGQVALVEDQVEHVQDRAQPLRPLVAARHLKRDGRRPDRLLGAADPLCHRRLRDEKRVGDLGRGQATDRSQSEGDRRCRRQLGMAGHEHQRERVVVVGRRLRVARLARCDERLAIAPRRLASGLVDHPAARHLDQPADRVVGRSLAGPLLGRSEHRLLRRVLGVGEVAESSHDRGEDLRRRFAQQVLDVSRSAHSSDVWAPITSRTSIAVLIGFPPGPGAAEASAAISIARSNDSTSTIR